MNAINSKQFEILNNWQYYLNDGNLSEVLKLYNSSCILIPTFSSEILTDHKQIKEYFVRKRSKDRKIDYNRRSFITSIFERLKKSLNIEIT